MFCGQHYFIFHYCSFNLLVLLSLSDPSLFSISTSNSCLLKRLACGSCSLLIPLLRHDSSHMCLTFLLFFPSFLLFSIIIHSSSSFLLMRDCVRITFVISLSTLVHYTFKPKNTGYFTFTLDDSLFISF